MPNKTPLGKPLPLTNKDLEKMTTADEIKKAPEAAARLWVKSVPDDLKDLLDAIEITE